MKAFIAAAVGAFGASWYQTRNGSVAEAYSWLTPEKAFSQEEFLPYKLVDVQQETHNVKRFRFALRKSSTQLNLPVTSCITLRYMDEKGEEVMRPYTPLNLSTDKGHFDLLIKWYPNSKMGSHVFNLKIGDTIDVKGPWATLDIKPGRFKSIGMIAGGSGITPMYQVINNLASVTGDKTSMSLVMCNLSAEDILLNKELTEVIKKKPGQFAVHHVLEKSPATWGGYKGRVTKEIIKETMPGADEKDAIVLVSGPPPFMKAVCGAKDYSKYPPAQGAVDGFLKELGYPSASVYKY